MKKKIIIISGDPNSINSELIYKSWKKIDKSLKKRIYFISNFDLLHKQFKKLNYLIKLTKVKNIYEDVKNDSLKIININLKFKNPFKVTENSSSRFVFKSLEYAHKIALDKNVGGIINCAINKRLLKKGKIGVTEFLASKCNVKNKSEVMLIRNEKLSVSPITTHINISQVSKKINRSIIEKKIRTINSWYKYQLNKKPKIGIMGLNPHNAELREKSEEVKIIIPSILKLKKLGFNLTGPLISDTLFIEDYKKYDVIIGMFHDQILAPFKTLFKFDAINVTLGLKYLRVSPDHGTAIDLIGKNKAVTTSFLSCINFLNKFGK